MVPNSVEIAVDIAGILLSAVIVVLALPLIRKGRKPITTTLFVFAVISFMLSLAYWLTYSIIHPEGRMPFAANEIGEIAWFLLLASVLESFFRDIHTPARKEIAFTVLYAAASVALWIGWSGEWIQDIIVGLAFGYYLCICVRSLKQSEAFGRNEWILLGVSCGLIILGQAGTFFVSETVKGPLDLLCYGLMFVALIWLFAKRMVMTGRGAGTKATLAMSFALYGFSSSILYLSSGWFYMAVLVLCLVTLPLMLMAMKREVMT